MSLILLLDTQPPDIWHDTVVQLIVVVITTLLSAFIGGAIAILVYRRQKSKKEITYQIISDAPIASINQTVADRVELRFDGNPIKEARILVLKVWNSGNVAIKRDDYDEPITFEFNSRKVVSSDILETEPTDLIDPKSIKTFLILNDESIQVPRFLLNPKQSISLTTLLIGAKTTISVRGRIIDGKIIELSSDRQSKYNRYIAVGAAGALLASIGAIGVVGLAGGAVGVRGVTGAFIAAAALSTTVAILVIGAGAQALLALLDLLGKNK